MSEFEFSSIQVLLDADRFNIPVMARRSGERAIIYLHGLGSPKEDFADAVRVDALSDYTLLLYDAPGHGQSRYVADRDLTIRDLAEICKQLICAYRISSVTLIGQSMGGLTALLAAATWPELIDRLVLVEGNLTPEDCFHSRRIFENEMMTEEVLFDSWIDSVHRENKRSFELFSRLAKFHLDPRAFAGYCRSIVHYSDNCALLDQFINLSMPKLFIYGSDNEHLSYLPELGESDVQVAPISGSDHFPHYSNPVEFYSIIADFLSSD